MSRLVTFSSRRGRCLRALIAVLVTSVAGFAVAPAALAQPVVTQDEALADAFPPPATIDRRTAFLDEAQLAEARSFAGPGVEVNRSVVTYYVGTWETGESAVAYFDAHRVRTLPEAVMILVGDRGDIRMIRVLKFSEPPEYRAPAGWLDRFAGHGLNDELELKRGIDGISGATITSRVVTNAARRVLALHAVIRPLGVAP